MKGKDFAQRLTDFSIMLRDAGACEQATAWQAMVPVFESSPNRNVSAICSVLSGVKPPEHGNGLRLQAMIGLIPALKRFLRGVNVKQPLLDDVETIGKTLGAFRETSAAAFADAAVQHFRDLSAPTTREPPRQALDGILQSYLQRLEEALGDESRFLQIFNTLKSDADVKSAEVKKLARAFAKETAKSKTAALDLIWGRHAALTGSRARQQANTGRTAA
jgi:hypothetical protein